MRGWCFLLYLETDNSIKSPHSCTGLINCLWQYSIYISPSWPRLCKVNLPSQDEIVANVQLVKSPQLILQINVIIFDPEEKINFKHYEHCNDFFGSSWWADLRGYRAAGQPKILNKSYLIIIWRVGTLSRSDLYFLSITKNYKGLVKQEFSAPISPKAVSYTHLTLPMNREV